MSTSRRPFKWPAQQGLVSSDVASQLPEEDRPRRQPRWEQRREEQADAQLKAMALFEMISEHLGGLLSLERSIAAGDVLYTGTRLLDANGVDTMEFPGGFQAVTVTNFTAGVLFVSNSPVSLTLVDDEEPFILGAGIITVTEGSMRTIPLRGQALSLFGTGPGPVPSGVFDLSVFQRPRDPFFAQFDT